MRLTSKNHNEMKLLAYYTPGFLKAIPIDDESAKVYFDWSDRGIGREHVETRVAEENRTKKFTGLSALYFAKRYRDLAITSYLEDWGTTVTALDFMDEPYEIVEFLAKALKKPAILTFWRTHNAPEMLTEEDRFSLEPLREFRALGEIASTELIERLRGAGISDGAYNANHIAKYLPTAHTVAWDGEQQRYNAYLYNDRSELLFVVHASTMVDALALLRLEGLAKGYIGS